jgi:hypothetical protein
VDHGRTLTSSTAKMAWSGLAELEGQAVMTVSEEGRVARLTVAGGGITLPEATRRVTVGTPFTHEVEPMPVPVPSGRGVSFDHPYRPVRVSFRVIDTGALRVDVGSGPKGLIARPPGAGAVTGDQSLRAIGWRRGLGQPPWRVVQDDPVPSTILSVSTEIKVNE